jgi:uncharacterized ferritin-like protein (DUF455 family)
VSDAAPTTLTGAASAVLSAPDPADKVALTQSFASAWRDGRLAMLGDTAPPARPARPPRPLLKAPSDMPRRRAGGSAAGRIALLHAVAHIELNALDLAWDLIARFATADLPRAFHDDWVGVAAEEAKHHAMVTRRLVSLGAAYGDLPAHDGLWEAAQETAGDLLARLAVVPLVLEARGLDVTPDMIERMRRFGDDESVAILEILYAEEIAHVRAGFRWFAWECARRALLPATTYQDLVRRHYGGFLKPPFNRAAREAAGFPADFYSALTRD